MTLIDHVIDMMQQIVVRIKAVRDAKIDKDRIINASVSVDFPSIPAAMGTSELTFTVPGVVTSDFVGLVYSTNVNSNIIFQVRVSAANTVRIRAWNAHPTVAQDPINGTYQLRIIKTPT